MNDRAWVEAERLQWLSQRERGVCDAEDPALCKRCAEQESYPIRRALDAARDAFAERDALERDRDFHVDRADEAERRAAIAEADEWNGNASIRARILDEG